MLRGRRTRGERLLLGIGLLIACAAAPVPRLHAQAPAPFVPPPVVTGGQVIPLYPPASPHLKKERLAEPEAVTPHKTVPGRIQSVANVHNPTIEVHLADSSNNTGAAVIVIPGGGHRMLVIGSEGADLVPFFFNYGVATIILKHRLRQDGYVAEIDAVRDAQQAVRIVRARAREWNIDPQKIGMMGFSAGAELVAPAALRFDEFDAEAAKDADGGPAAGSRPDFAALIYPGPTPFARNPTHPVPRNTPPSFIATAGVGDAVHAVWADEYFAALLNARIPNLEMHVYGNGGHGGGIRDRNGIPFGTWHYRFIDWVRDLGFLGKPGEETKAARDTAASLKAQPPGR